MFALYDWTRYRGKGVATSGLGRGLHEVRMHVENSLICTRCPC
jgi:hypothetical protein